MSVSSISSIATSPSVRAPDPVQPKTPDIQDNSIQSAGPGNPQNNSASDNDDASEAPKPAPAPLPPGQGTRIDQLV